MRFLMSCWLVLSVSIGHPADVVKVQTDWSGGPGTTGPVPQWNNTFESHDGTSWLSVPDRLALSSRPVEYPVPHLVDGFVDGIVSVFAGDIDGDGDVDLMGAAWNEDALVWWQNDGCNPPAWVRHTITENFDGACHVYSCDMDFDGDLDVLGTAWYANEVAWWRNDGGSPLQWTKQTVDASFAGAHWVCAADLDDDSDLDLVAAAAVAHDIAWWRNEGGDPPQWSRWYIDQLFVSARSVQPADMDGDGDLDLVGAALNYNDIAWWRNNGGDPLLWTKHMIDGSFEDPTTAFPADIDSDGDYDVVASGFLVHSITWWRNDGLPEQWHEETIDGAVDGAWFVYPADIDGDGDIDVVGSGREADTIHWWQNQGESPVTWVEYLLAEDFDGAGAIHAVDIDDDADLDVVACAISGDKVVWWDVTEFCEAGELTSSVLDLEARPHQAWLEWNAYEPVGTGLRVRLRTSPDPDDLGDWSDDLPCPADLGDGLQRYVQYQVLLETDDSGVSPALEEISLSYESLAGEPQPVARPGLRLECRPMPGRGEFSVRLELRWDSLVNLDVYDLSGKRVARVIAGHLASGVHELRVSDFDAGVYVCRLEACGSLATKRVVVLK